jgi:hypothetical protein
MGEDEGDADGAGVVSHAGSELLRELGAATGLGDAWDKVLVSTYRALTFSPWPGARRPRRLGRRRGDVDIGHEGAEGPAPALRGGCIHADGLAGAGQGLGGSPTGPAHWACQSEGGGLGCWGGARPRPRARARHRRHRRHLPLRGQGRCCPTWKHTFGSHPLYCFLDRPEVSSGEALSGLLRPGNAGSNTAEDHKEVFRLALGGPRLRPAHQRRGRAGLPRAHRLCGRHPRARQDICNGLVSALIRPQDQGRARGLQLRLPRGREGAHSARHGRRGGLVPRHRRRRGGPGESLRGRAHRLPGAQLTLFEGQDGWRYTAFIPTPVLGSCRSNAWSSATASTRGPKTGPASPKRQGSTTSLRGQGR